MTPSPNRSRRDGFTLIELMIVMMIIGLVGAIAYPQYQVLSRANLRETSRKAAGTIRYLYARAILDKKAWRLALDMDDNRMWAERLEKNEEGAGLEYKKMKTRVLRRITIPDGVKIRDVRVLGRDERTDGIEYIYFNPYGGTERAVIHLMHENERWVFTLATKPASGRVAIFDHDVDIELTPIKFGDDAL